MIQGIGTDIIEVARVEGAISRYGQKFLDRCFTQAEQKYCLKFKESQRNFAGRFAAKEAIVKALGTGFGEEIAWLEIEVLNNESGGPVVKLQESASVRFGNPEVKISISHCKEYATAFAVVSD